MNIAKVLFFSLLSWAVLACVPTQEQEPKSQVAVPQGAAPEKAATAKKEGLVKKYRKDGGLKTSINYQDGKKHGQAISYYKNGNIRQKIDYFHGVKHGIAETYYENGRIYQRTPYEQGRLHGVRKRFRQNGKLYSEMPYYHGNPTIGLREYTTAGERKKKYPEIVIEAIDQILSNDSYVLRVSMSDNSKKVEYYVGKLTNGKYIGSEAVRMVSQRPGILELRFDLPRGSMILKELNIIAKVTTKLKNVYITQKEYRLAIENRGY